MGVRCVMDAEVMRRRMAQAGYWLCVGGGGSFESETVSLLSAMTTQPTDLRKSQINTLIVSLKAAGVWSKLGVLYVFAAAAAQAALLNWKNPSGTAALATNSPTFTVDRGYSGDGVSAFIDTQISWSAVPGVSQNDAHIGAYVSAGNAAANFAGNSGAALLRLTRTAGGLLVTRVNDGTDTTSDSVPATAGTHLVASRSASGGYARYIDGTAGTASVVASTGVGTGTLVGLRSGGTYGASTTSLRALHAGSNLTAAEVLAVRSALQTYMAAVGAS